MFNISPKSSVETSTRKTSEFLGGVVYEDPWLAGGHNGLSNSEDPEKPQDPYPRVKDLRKLMNQFDLNDIPIIMAGGVWNLSEWSNWINNYALRRRRNYWPPTTKGIAC